MSVRQIERVLQHSRAASATEQAVLLVLANFANDDGTSCFPSVVTIAKHARTSPASVKRAITRLVSAGDLSRVRRGSASNLYALNLREAGGDGSVRAIAQSEPKLTVSHQIAQVEPGDGSTCAVGELTLSPDPSLIRQQNRQKNRHPRQNAARGRAAASVKLPGIIDDDQRLVESYGRQFEAEYRAKPQLDWPRDRTLMRQLLKQHAPAVIEGAMTAMFASTDPWIAQSGRTLPFFRGQFNRFLAAASGSRRVAATGKTAGNVAALQGFVTRVQGGAA